MEKRSEKATPVLTAFIERSKIDKDLRYVAPSIVRTTKWGADQFGWPATCDACNEVWCVYAVSKDGSRLVYPRCMHPNKTIRNVRADNAYIRGFH